MFHLFTLKKVLENSTRNYLRLTLKHSSFRATTAQFSPDQRYVIVDVNKTENTGKNEQLKYPLIWLRDNCQCSSCIDSQTKSRIIDWAKFDFKNAQPKNISVSQFIKILHGILSDLISSCVSRLLYFMLEDLVFSWVCWSFSSPKE